MATFCCTAISLASHHLLSVIDSVLLNNRPSRVVVMWLCVSGWAEGGVVVVVVERGTGWGASNSHDPNPPSLFPFLFSVLSPCSLKLEVLIQAVGPRGKSCLSVWNFIIFNHLDHDGSCFLSLPLPPFHLVTQTQAFLTQPCLSVCRSASFPSSCCLTLAYHAN